MAEEMIFPDITPVEIPVAIGARRYKLRPVTVEGACKWRNAAASCAVMQDGKVVGVRGVADVEPLLVSLCLYNLDEGGNIHLTKSGDPDVRYLVPIQVVRTWRPDVVAALFAKAKEISHLEDKPASVDDLEKQIRDAQEKLDRLRRNGASHTEELAGNLQGALNPNSV